MMNKPCHVAVIVDAWIPFWGGGQEHVKNLFTALKKHHFVTHQRFAPKKSSLWYRLIWSFFAPFKILRLHQQKPFTLIHSHGYNSGFVAKLASKLIGVPVVHTVHGSNSLDLHNLGIKARIEKWVLTELTYEAQISVAHTFLNHPNINTNITVIPNGVHVKAYDEVKIKKSKFFRIIWVGRISEPLKNVKILKKAFQQLKPFHPYLQLKLITGGKTKGKNLIKAYKEAHCFVLPSISEGQPITLLEAWAAKLPVVATAVGDNPKMVKNSKNGYLIAPNDIEALKKAIQQLIRNPKKAKAMGKEGYEYVKAHHTWETIANHTHKVYNSVIQNKK